MASKNRLTPKQQRFAELVASGKCLTDAYRGAYDAEGMKPSTIRTESSKLFCRPDITMTIDRLRERREAAIVSAGVSDRERVLQKLRYFVDNATSADMPKIRAAELLGKTVGLFKDVQVQVPERTVDDARTDLEAVLARVFPDQPDGKAH
ncbi:hypothetical protein ACFL1V_01425 [Pseudomonadota bacterium]